MRWPPAGWSRQAVAFAAGCALVVAANAAYLGRVVVERAGEPQAVMELTARELQPEWVWNEEDSRQALSWRYVNRSDLDEQKLAAFGIDRESCRGPHSGERTAWGALEMNGEGWRSWAAERRQELEEGLAELDAGPESEAEAEWLHKEIDEVEKGSSRLAIVAVEPRRGPLVERYSGRPDVAVVPLLVRCAFDHSAEGQRKPMIGGLRLMVTELHVPAALRRPIDRVAEWRESEGVNRYGRSVEAGEGPGYVARVAFGRGGVARLVAVEPLPE
ncbi:MAG TPA: DUF4824 family protein [Thermoanaerobaculia bacterium]|nr:DUF4824 family protein [Thermoanaerobaculia bacterium]